MHPFVRLGLAVAVAVTSGGCTQQPEPAPREPLGAEPRAMASAKARVELPTGVTLAYVEAGLPDGEVVIFLHGFTDTSRSFLPTLERLAVIRPDLRLVALDQRGHGEASMPPGEECPAAPERCFRLEDFAADLLAFMDARGIGRAHLVGHSLGSLIGQEFALAHPDRVGRLVLIATTASLKDSPVLREYFLAGLVEGPWKEAFVGKGYAFPGEAYAVPPADVDPAAGTWIDEEWVADPVADPAYLEAIRAETRRVPLGTWQGVARALLTFDNTERLEALSVPTLVIWPTQDSMFSEADQQTLRDALDRAADRCTTSYVWKQYGRAALPASGAQESDIGHNVQWGAPDAVAADLAAFLRDGGAPTGDLVHADPNDVRRVLTTPDAATLVERPAQNCQP